jgi:hypothetical protein
MIAIYTKDVWFHVKNPIFSDLNETNPVTIKFVVNWLLCNVVVLLTVECTAVI